MWLIEVVGLRCFFWCGGGGGWWLLLVVEEYMLVCGWWLIGGQNTGREEWRLLLTKTNAHRSGHCQQSREKPIRAPTREIIVWCRLYKR